MSLFRNVSFHASAAKITDLPPSDGPEIAFAGRSNAGKSSAINTLVNHKRLAFVSKVPGRTQLINYFRLPSGGHIVDLPGYGYADVPEAVRRQWQALLEHYLTRRPNLVGLVLIMDARRPLMPLDRQLMEWFLPTGRPMHVLLSKSDKLRKTEASATLLNARQVLEAFAPRVSVQLFSSMNKAGVEEAEEYIGTWMAAGEQSCRPKEKPPAKGEKTGG